MEIKKQNLNFQSIIEAAPVALILTNSKGKIIYANDFTNKMFDYKNNELENKGLEILLKGINTKHPPEYWHNYVAHPSAVAPEKENVFSARTKSGTEFPVEVRVTQVKTHENFNALITITNVSEREKAIEQLRLIVESALNSMLLTDSRGKIVMVNRQTELLFGYERNELIGKKIEVLVPQRMKDQHPHHRKQFYDHPKARPMGAGRDLYAVKKDGTEIPVEIGLNPVVKDGVQYVLASVIDITERKKQEEAIRSYARQIEEKNKELEEFAHVASHDLREPLNSIISLTEMLMQRKSDQLDEEGNKMLDFIDKSASRMTELITGLLEYAQLGSSKELVLTDLNELLETVLLDLNSSIQAAGAKINKEKLPVLKIYPIEFRLLFQNIISNAIKYRQEGVLPEISVSSKPVRNGWEFLVADNGIGIPENQKEKIFDLFHRLHGRNKYEGTGIGLAHCRKVIELHNGRIWVESELGEGSTFFFFIPEGISQSPVRS